MKLHSLILLAVLPLALPANAEPIDVARVDLNRIQSQIGSQQLSWLHAPERVRIAVRDVDKKIAGLQSDMMEATNHETLNEIQQTLSFYQSKRSMLLSTVSASTSNWQQRLHQFIKDRFGDEFQLIFQQNSYSITQYTICAELRETDITDRVIAEIEKHFRHGPEEE